MSGLDGLGWPNPEDEPKPKKTMNSQLEIKLAPTPETDDATLVALDIDGGGEFEAVNVQVSKRLERERDRCQELADALVDRLGATQERMINAERERDDIRAQLREEQQLHVQTLNERDEAREQRDRLAEALRNLCDEFLGNKSSRDITAQLLEAFKALQYLNQPTKP